jgi:hypothetical protein
MNKMKSIQLIAVACALAGVSPAFAGTIDFEAAPTGVDLGNFYSGVTFAPGLQAEFQVLPTSPAHSGFKELVGTDSGNPNMSFTFATPESTVSFWYTTLYGFTVTAYNSSSAEVGSPIVVPANTGTDSFLSLTGPGISSVTIHSTLGFGTFDTIDDLSAPGISGLPAPDAASTLGLFGVASVALLAFRRKFAVR